LNRYISAYLTAFFSLPVIRHTGERLSHEEVVNKLEDETVNFEATLGMSRCIEEILRVTIRVEVAKYGEAVAWLRDLIFGSVFDKERYIHHRVSTC
jgi:Zn-dependent M16 (insulinase) family peptidase